MGFAGDPETSAASSIDVRRASHSALAGRITELEQSLAASEARVVELERELVAFQRSFDGHVYVKNDDYVALHRRAEAAESAASTAMRDGMMEAARIGAAKMEEYRAAAEKAGASTDEQQVTTMLDNRLLAEGAREAVIAIRTRASSLPGGEGEPRVLTGQEREAFGRALLRSVKVVGTLNPAPDAAEAAPTPAIHFKTPA